MTDDKAERICDIAQRASAILRDDQQIGSGVKFALLRMLSEIQTNALGKPSA